MRHVKTKNSITVLTILSLLTSCKEQKYSIEKQEVKEPLVFKVDFKNYGEYQIKMNKENGEIMKKILLFILMSYWRI